MRNVSKFFWSASAFVNHLAFLNIAGKSFPASVSQTQNEMIALFQGMTELLAEDHWLTMSLCSTIWLEVRENLNTAAPFTFSLLPNPQKWCLEPGTRLQTIKKDGSAELSANGFSRGSHGQTQDFCEHKSVRSRKTQNPNQLWWNTSDNIPEMEMKASWLKCFDKNVYVRMSWNRKEETQETEEKGTDIEWMLLVGQSKGHRPIWWGGCCCF